MEVKSRSGVGEVSRSLASSSSGGGRLAASDAASILGLLQPVQRTDLLRQLSVEQQRALDEWDEHNAQKSLSPQLHAALRDQLPRVVQGHERIRLLSQLLLQELSRHKKQMRWQVQSRILSEQDVQSILLTLRNSVDSAFNRRTHHRIETLLRWLNSSADESALAQTLREVEVMTKRKIYQQLSLVEKKLQEMQQQPLPKVGILVDIPPCALAVTVRNQWGVPLFWFVAALFVFVVILWA